MINGRQSTIDSTICEIPPQSVECAEHWASIGQAVEIAIWTWGIGCALIFVLVWLALYTDKKSAEKWNKKQENERKLGRRL